MDTMLRRRAMIAQGGAPTPPPGRLPSGYTEVDYLESGGTAQIRIDITGEMDVFLSAQCSAPGSSSQILVGFTSTAGAWFGNTSSCWGLGASNRTNISSSTKADIEVSFKLPTTEADVNGSTCQRAVQGSPFSTVFYLFGYSSFNFNGKVFGDVIIKQSGNETFHGVPCISPDNKVGYFDLVSETFVGTYQGTLTYGYE